MPDIAYKALNPRTGKIIEESGEFRDLRDLFYTLQQEGLYLIKYKTRGKRLSILSRKPSRLEIADFCRNISFLMAGGVPILQGLEDLQKSTENKVLKHAIKAIIYNITNGFSFANSLEKTGNVFPPVVRSLASIGEETGKLDQTMQEAATHLVRVDDIITQTKRAMWYPAFVLTSVGLALSVWIFYVLPKIFVVFKDMNVQLPMTTRALIKIVEYAKSYWFLLPIVILLFITMYFMSRRSEKLSIFLEKTTLKIPLLGKAKRLSITAFFFEYMSLLIGSGIDILKSLKLMADSITSAFMKTLIPPIEKNIQEGDSLRESCEKVGFFSTMELRMIGTGEESGRLPEQLKLLGDFYYKKLMSFVESIPKIIEPMLIFTVGIVFMVIILALLGPVYELISVIGKNR